MPNPTAPASTLTLTRPDDWHLHLRDGAGMARVLAATADVFGRAIIMPNLRPAVTHHGGRRAYRDAIVGALRAGSRFEPLMTLYLTDNTSPTRSRRRRARLRSRGQVLPGRARRRTPTAGVTRSSAPTRRSRRWKSTAGALGARRSRRRPTIDVFDRERVFVERSLAAIVRDFPGLQDRRRAHHDAEGGGVRRAAPAASAATITPQHLLYSRNALFAGGIRPHYYCLPILKREAHRRRSSRPRRREPQVLSWNRLRAARAEH
jgi:dihydroorotase